MEALLTRLRRHPDIIDRQDCQGQTALMNAAFNGHQNALLLLLHYHANMNVSDIEGNSALHLAAIVGNVPCVKAMLYYSEHQSFPLQARVTYMCPPV